MKYIKNYKLFETGEWSSDLDWQYTKDNPDDDCEEVNWIRSLEKDLRILIGITLMTILMLQLVV